MSALKVGDRVQGAYFAEKARRHPHRRIDTYPGTVIALEDPATRQAWVVVQHDYGTVHRWCPAGLELLAGTPENFDPPRRA